MQNYIIINIELLFVICDGLFKFYEPILIYQWKFLFVLFYCSLRIFLLMLLLFLNSSDMSFM